jgi:hypothetical protein
MHIMSNCTVATVNSAAGGAVVYGLAQLFMHHPQAAAAGWTALVVANIAPHMLWDYDTAAAKVNDFVAGRPEKATTITMKQTVPSSQVDDDLDKTTSSKNDSQTPASSVASPTSSASRFDLIHRTSLVISSVVASLSEPADTYQTTETVAHEDIFASHDDVEVLTPSETHTSIYRRASAAISSFTTSQAADIASDEYQATVPQAEDDRTFGNDDYTFDDDEELFVTPHRGRGYIHTFLAYPYDNFAMVVFAVWTTGWVSMLVWALMNAHAGQQLVNPFPQICNQFLALLRATRRKMVELRNLAALYFQAIFRDIAEMWPNNLYADIAVSLGALGLVGLFVYSCFFGCDWFWFFVPGSVAEVVAHRQYIKQHAGTFLAFILGYPASL